MKRIIALLIFSFIINDSWSQSLKNPFGFPNAISKHLSSSLTPSNYSCFQSNQHQYTPNNYLFASFLRVENEYNHIDLKIGDKNRIGLKPKSMFNLKESPFMFYQIFCQ